MIGYQIQHVIATLSRVPSKSLTVTKATYLRSWLTCHGQLIKVFIIFIMSELTLHELDACKIGGYCNFFPGS